MGNHQYEKEGDVYSPLTICQQFYRNGSISPSNETFDINAQVDEGDVQYVCTVKPWLCSALQVTSDLVVLSSRVFADLPSTSLLNFNNQPAELYSAL